MSGQRAEPTRLPQDGATCSRACRCGAGMCQEQMGEWKAGGREAGGADIWTAGRACCDSGGRSSRASGEQRWGR